MELSKRGVRREALDRKYKQRLDLYGLKETEGRFYAYKSSSCPCSCRVCRDEKYSRKQKHKNDGEV